MSEQTTAVQHPVLDRAPKSIKGAISLYSMKDGSRRIGGRDEFIGENFGSIGFPWKESYRKTMDDVIQHLESVSKGWMAFYAKYLQGERIDTTPMHGRNGATCTSFVASGEAYTAYHGTDHTGHFLGFGGQFATVTLADGTTIESNNLWHNGTVPAYLRDSLKDNATLVWGRAKATGSAT